MPAQFLFVAGILLAAQTPVPAARAYADAIVGRTVFIQLDPALSRTAGALRILGPDANDIPLRSGVFHDGNTAIVSLREPLPDNSVVVLAAPAPPMRIPITRRPLVPALKAMRHPGLLHSREELDFIRAQVEARRQPWLSGWETMRTWRGAALAHVAAPPTVLDCPRTGPWPYTIIEQDGAAAWVHALHWSVTRDSRHARKAIEILNAYAATLQVVTGPDRALRSGLYGYQFVNAAEIIKHSDAGWPSDGQQRFAAWLDRVFWPHVKDGGSDLSNWDCGTILTGLCIGIYQDDPIKANYALNRLAAHIPKYIWPTGQCNETARDQNHTQFGIGLLALACEVAWQQGVDAFGLWGNRVAKGFEYTARVRLGKQVPFESWGRFPRATGPSARGAQNHYPVYAVAFNHYHSRRGLPLNEVAELLQSQGPEGFHRDIFGFGTLHHTGMQFPSDDAPREPGLAESLP